MNDFIDRLALLYNKIHEGTASDDEIEAYEMGIEMSCVQKDVLVKEIKQKAKELKRLRRGQR